MDKFAIYKTTGVLLMIKTPTHPIAMPAWAVPFFFSA
ncbi:MAG: hypothetical protein ACI9UA_003664 [Pseudoalteromonas tetraodonis]|jgi:hypothetical protein